MPTEITAQTRIGLKCEGPVAEITLNNSPLNVIDVLMMDELAAALAEIDLHPDISTIVFRGDGNCFSAGALRAADGAFLLGRMARHTANAGKIYFPAGTPDPGDVGADGAVDLMGSVLRELAEETGLLASEVSPGPRWYAALAGARIGLMRPLRLREASDKLAARIRAFIAGEKEPELEDVVVVREPAGLVPEIPDFVRAYIESEWTA